MDARYRKPILEIIFSNERRLLRWQDTELAVIKAGVEKGEVPLTAYKEIKAIWERTPINIKWWEKRDNKIQHDLNAFIDERIRHLPKRYHKYVHRYITSYDTQESGFSRMLLEALDFIEKLYADLEQTVVDKARYYRYQLLLERTHGQGAELKTLGARILCYLAELRLVRHHLSQAREDLNFSKISGACGNYPPGINPDLEEKALGHLGFKPFIGATQIMPRTIYIRVAEAMSSLVGVVNKIALDIRLDARSGRPLVHEPFGKEQKGSSAMPGKKNPIKTEQIEGMDRLARGYVNPIKENIRTWAARAIEQSCVERNAWPDLFHATAHCLETLTKVLKGLVVYPDNMLTEIHESRGTYASGAIKEFFKEKLEPMGISHEIAYRAAQLACFNVFELPPDWQILRNTVPKSMEQSVALLKSLSTLPPIPMVSVQDFVPQAKLRVSAQLAVSANQVKKMNGMLRKLFAQPGTREEWDRCFDPAYILRDEAHIYRYHLNE